MQPQRDIPERLVAILKSIGIVAQQRVLEQRLLEHRLARSHQLDPSGKPTVPLNRTPYQACQTSAHE